MACLVDWSQKARKNLDSQLIDDVFTGARMVECCAALGLIVIWYGGASLMHVFTMEDLEPVYAWTNTDIEDASDAQVDAREFLQQERSVRSVL